MKPKRGLAPQVHGGRARSEDPLPRVPPLWVAVKTAEGAKRI
jgi:hypothetical protein